MLNSAERSLTPLQRGTKSELQMLRELAWWVLPRLECYFCHRPILDGPQTAMTFGHRRHPPLVDTKFTMHHADKDRENNTVGRLIYKTMSDLVQSSGNVKIAHKRCHQAFHANERRQDDPSDEPTNR